MAINFTQKVLDQYNKEVDKNRFAGDVIKKFNERREEDIVRSPITGREITAKIKAPTPQAQTKLQEVGGFLQEKVIDPAQTFLTGKEPRERGYNIKTPEGDVIREPGIGPSIEVRKAYRKLPELDVAPGSPAAPFAHITNFIGRVAELPARGAAVGAVDVSNLISSGIGSQLGYGEFMDLLEEQNKQMWIPIDARRIGEQQKEMTTSAGQMLGMMDEGYEPLEAALMTFGTRTLDVAIAGSMTSSLAKLTIKHLSKAGGGVQKVDAWKRLGAPKNIAELKKNYRQLAHEFHPDKSAGLGSKEMFSLLTKDKKALTDKAGNFIMPTKTDFTKYQIWKMSEPLSKETVVTEMLKVPPVAKNPKTGKIEFSLKTNQWKDIWDQAKTFPQRAIKPNIGAKPFEPYQSEIAGLLPGWRKAPGQGPPLGLSLERWEKVGGTQTELAQKLVDKLGRDKANKVIQAKGNTIISQAVAKGVDTTVAKITTTNADKIIAEGTTSFTDPDIPIDIYKFPRKDVSALRKSLDPKLVTPKAPEISPELQPFVEKAKKYPSAEEFVKAQTTGYKGMHEAPTRTDDAAAPAHKLDKIYPSDIYSSDAARLYSSGMPYDAETISILQGLEGKPNATLTVYRAVPGTKTNVEMISEYELQKKQILKTGKIPDVEIAEKYNLKDSSSYYEFIDREIQRLRGATEPKVEKYAINEGDWVTPNRKYAVDHGMSELGGSYKILSKKVRADELFTDANSIQEFGYSPRESTIKTKSQLTDIWKQTQATPEISPELQPPGDVAMRTMRDGTQRPAIRDTGVYAPKEFELHEGKDISGLLGGQSWNLRDALISWDNLHRTELAKLGDVGPGEKLAYQGREVDVSIMEFGNKQAQRVRDIAKRHGLNLNKEKTDIQLTLALHGLTNEAITAKGAKQAIIDTLKKAEISEGAIQQATKPGFLQGIRGKESKIVEVAKDGLPGNVLSAARGELRQHFNTLREQANPVRESLGKSPIKHRENYGPVLQGTSFWSKMRPQQKTEITDNFDYIIPNAKKNPHALPRKAGAADLEWKASKLLERYHESIARDMFDAPYIEQLKAVNSVLKPKYPNTAKLIEKHIREARVGKPAQFDSLLGITEGTKKRAALNELNLARTIQALSANLVWMGFIQPASLVLSVAKAGPINMSKGIYKFATDSTSRKYVNTLPVIKTKRKGMSIGSTGAGDIDKLGSNIVKGKLETFKDFTGKLVDANEYWLTGSSALAGKEKAKAIGLEGKAADIYADWMGGSTQSEYIKTARPMISNNIIMRTSWPFQTYAFELYRYGKTLAGLPGGRPLEMTERLNQIILLLSGMYAYDAYLDKAIGRRLSTEKIDVGDIPDVPIITSEGKLVVPRVATWAPMASDIVDDIANRAYRMVGIEDPDRRFSSGQRAAGAIVGDIQSFLSAVDGYTRQGNIQPLRKELTKWGMGFSGAPGASTINRLVDGLIATAQGYQTDRAGRRLFRIEGIDQYLAPLLGPYSTRAGIEFFKEGGSIIERDAKKEKERLYNLSPEEAKEEFEEIQHRNPNLARMINRLIEDDKNPILKEIRGLSSEMKAEKLVELFEDIPESQRREEYQKLIDSGEVTKDVTKKYTDLLQKQEQTSRGIMPDFKDGESRGDKAIISTVSLYAKAIGTDPIDAFQKIFAGEELKRIDNGAIIIERMSFEGSEKIREERARASELKGMRLDHTIPLQLGGTNREDNLILVSEAEHNAYTPIENLLGDHLRAGNIGRKDVQKLIKDFKEGKVPVEEILKQYPPTGEGLLERFNQDFLDAIQERQGGITPSGFANETFKLLDNSL